MQTMIHLMIDNFKVWISLLYFSFI